MSQSDDKKEQMPLVGTPKKKKNLTHWFAIYNSQQSVTQAHKSGGKLANVTN